jgi:CHASE3 domain sensor protein/serine phosphatase RsbU (regulator of sigma subunit)
VSLRVRLLGLLCAVVLVVSSATVVANVALTKVRANRTLVTERLQPAGAQSRSLLTALVNQETGERGFLLTGNRAFLEPYRRGDVQFTRALAALRREFPRDPQIRTALGRVQEAARTWVRVGATPEIDARRRGDAREARALVAAGNGKRAFDVLRRRVEELQQEIDDRTTRAQHADETNLRILRWVNLGSRLVNLVLLLAAAFLVRRWVLSPVGRLRERMRAVADGNLEDEVLVAGPPEVVAIARDAESMRRRIVSELETSRAATEALTQHSPVVAGLRRELASSTHPPASGLDLAGVVLSAEGVLAGDWWEATQRPDGSTAIIVADVSGHGAEAGLVALRFKQRITALLDTDLPLSTAFDIAASRPDVDVERFLSCLVVVVDPRARTVSWINAGHPPALLVSRDRPDHPVELPPTGPLISSVTQGWQVATATITDLDMMLICTDGVLEARDSQGAEFGSEGVRRVLRGLRRWSPEEAVAECSEAVRQFAVDLRRDDVTCVAFRLAGGLGTA